jgi:hypothetical protein
MQVLHPVSVEGGWRVPALAIPEARLAEEYLGAGLQQAGVADTCMGS